MKRTADHIVPNIKTGTGFLSGRQLKKGNYGQFGEQTVGYEKEGIKFEQYQGATLLGLLGSGAFVNLCSVGAANAIAQGSGEGTRTHDEITMRSLHVTISIDKNAELVSTQQDMNHFIELWCFVDKQPNGNFPTMTDLYAGTSPGNYQKQVQAGIEARYTVLYHKVLQLPQSGHTYWRTQNEPPVLSDVFTYSKEQTRTEFTIPLNIKTKYLGIGGTIGALGTNALHLFAAAASSKIICGTTWTLNYENE